jgi:hypothetical protein
MQWLRRLFGGQSAAADPALHLYVRCNNCGAGVHVRIHLYNDLSIEYGATDVDGYTLRKEIMDSRCFRLMHAELRFDKSRRELSRTIEGGTFISAEEHAALTAPAERT